MSTLADRLKKVRTELSFTMEQLAQELINNGVKITARTILSYETSERQPSVSYIQALAENYDVNLEWLITNRGEMFYSEINRKSAPANVDISNMVFIPLLDMTVSAGHGTLVEDSNPANQDYISFTRTWLQRVTQTDEKYLLGYTVKGDSMLGEINDGDIIIVNTQYNDLSTEGTFAVNIDNEMYVKILQKLPDNKVQVVSANKKYSPFVVDLNTTSNFRIKGKVIWSGGIKDVC